MCVCACVCMFLCECVHLSTCSVSKLVNEMYMDVLVGDAYEILSERFTERKRVKSIGQVKKSIKIRSC